MYRLKTALQKMVGGIKKVSRAEYYMLVAIMGIPLAIIIFIETPEFKIFSFGLITVSILSWIAGIINMQLENKRQQKKELAFYELLEAIHEELRGLRQDRNDRNQKPDG